jgi:NADP-dependent 3-hydroxy acid dehydrogenase YdfG
VFKGFARSFAIAGAKGIVLVARSLNQLQEAAEELGKEFPKTQFLPLACDVRSETSVKAVFEQIRATFGTADVLVNNAGASDDGQPLRSASAAAVWEPFVRIQETAYWVCNANAFVGDQPEGFSPHGP